MKISSLSLELASGQTQEFGAVTNRTSLKHRLKEIMETVVFEELDLGSKHSAGATEVSEPSGALTMPMLLVQAKVKQVEIIFTYDLLSKEEGLLALFATCTKEGTERQKEFGFVSISELEEHLQRLLAMSLDNFIEHYFPQSTCLDNVVKYFGIAYIGAACFGLLSFMFFSDLIWRDELFYSAYIAAGVTYVVTLPILLLQAMSPNSRKRTKQMGQSPVKQVLAIIVGNFVLSFALVAGGCHLLHLVNAKPAKIDIVFSDKRESYWGKNCKGGVNIEQFSGTVCLEDRAYWKIIRSGMRASVEGRASIVAFDVKAIELK
ncbi:hypothetical protein L2719_12230 [Shewanella schlegeliana]|uniref:Uncharacterized protein n=1 Tax=Shewanella schlegeliana TaxID=190308 RepID=A0ABS1SVW2_9GAMM|nr:hypothetical protein [Shewanella schlegeliana]MBL4911732.1 hypothetical protein [Shewanella schlegeliana]MCL1110316.1 hypothetical protein [Shewanella schlegeliana]GIU31460.1 hypothetical protein TUM4433_23160 [Shewanella schlegeliana]